MLQGRLLNSRLLINAIKTIQPTLRGDKQFTSCVRQLIEKSVREKHWSKSSASFNFVPGFKRGYGSEPIGVEKTQTVNIGALSSDEFIAYLDHHHIQRGFVIFNETSGKLEASHPALQDLADRLGEGEFNYENHEAVFVGKGSRSNCLLCAFLWKTNRGQGSGGVDFMSTESMRDLLTEGHRLSKNLGIKCSLAGIWAGGGKGIIAAPDGPQHLDPHFRSQAYTDFGEFLTSLNGCFIAGLGMGTSLEDMEDMHSHTRYLANLSTNLGGTGLTALYTGLGVVKGMEAALDFLGLGSLEGKTVSIQGAGLVGEVLISELLKKGAKHIYVAESNKMRVEDVIDRFAQVAERRLKVSKVSFEDTSIFSRPCDIFSPCAQGRVLNKNTIPLLQTKIICGAENCPVDKMEDYETLKKMKILYTSDVVANRMGMVSKLVEPYGRLENDPVLNQHLSEDWEYSIYQTTLRILHLAEEKNISPEKAAYELGEELGKVDHPIFPNRAKDIVKGLVDSGWHEGKDFWRDRDMAYIVGDSDLL